MAARSDDDCSGRPPRYAPTARVLHWIVAGFVLVQIPLGLYMVARGAATSFDATTGQLYSLHKLFGFLALWLIVARIVVKLTRRPPPPVPTLTRFERIASHSVHGLLYLLLLAVPLLGWAGISAYPALDLFGVTQLPPILEVDEEFAEKLFGWHGLLAKGLGALALLHIAAALYHRFVKRDGVMARMWPPGG